MGLRNFDPKIFTGSLPLFDFISAPNNFKGSVTLEKSLLARLLSPIKVNSFLASINKPRICLAKVPEFPALILIFFL